MRIQNLCKDKKYGLLWLENYRCDGLFELSESETLDLADCELVTAEPVSALAYRFCLGGCDLAVYKNKEGMLTVMTPYIDTMGYGANYASILPGFPFKKVYGFMRNWELFIVGLNVDDKWGAIRLSHLRTEWPRSGATHCQPHEIVLFDYDNKEEVLDELGLSFSTKEMLEIVKTMTSDYYMNYVGNLEKVPDSKNIFASWEDGETRGMTPDEYRKLRVASTAIATVPSVATAAASAGSKSLIPIGVPFAVIFTDGTIIAHKKAIQTFIECLQKIGLDKVQAVGCMHNDYNLVSDIARPKDGKNIWQEEVEGKYIYTKMSNGDKLLDLLKISTYYGLDLRIEVS